MPSPLFADRPAPQPTEREAVDALITQTRRLRGDVDAVRQETADDDDTLWRWQQALCDLAVHQLDDLGAHLDQLRVGRPDGGTEQLDQAPLHTSPSDPVTASLIGRVGSAEWNLLSDEVSWSEELYRIFGRDPGSGPMSLDELPSLVFPEDQALLTAMVTGCLVDGRPIDGEFRVVRSDGQVRTVHMMGEPVPDSQGCTATMWAVLRDVSELRRSERAVRDTRSTLQRRQHIERTEHRLVVELQSAVLPSRSSSMRLSGDGPDTLEVAAHYVPSASNPLIGGDWYDALELPDGDVLLTVGDLTGHGVTATSTMAMLLGAVRGLGVAGIEPGVLLGHLNQLLDTADHPALGSALCSRYHPATRTFAWAQAGHPAPLLFRDGTGRTLTPPDGALLGATPGAAYEQADIQLLPGDILVLHTDGLTRDGSSAGTGQDRVLAMAPLVTAATTVRESAMAIVEEFGTAGREDDACVLVAAIGPRNPAR
jgi:serine phosphatase RsbU (regulator of sigma subunit)/PAS domain-containing protein